MAYDYEYKPPKKKRSFLWWVVMAVVLFSGYRYYLDYKLVDSGNRAMEKGDCITATQNYSEVEAAFRLFDIGGLEKTSNSLRLECAELYQAQSDRKNGEYESALWHYTEQALNYPNSVLTKFARGGAQRIISDRPAADYVSGRICAGIDDLVKQGAIKNKNATLPDIYADCGDHFFSIQDWENSMLFFYMLIDEYPNDANIKTYQQEIALAAYNYADMIGAGEIEVPEISGSYQPGKSMYIVNNATSEQIRIMLTGPQTVIKTLPACPSCGSYGVLGPMFCPTEATTGRYELLPGNYKVVVESITDSSITPYSGEWRLSGGNTYEDCFYVYTTSW